MAGTANLLHRSTLPAVDESVLRLISQAEAAAQLGIIEATLRTWVQRGWIAAPERIEGRPFFPQDAVNQAAENRTKRRTKRTKGNTDEPA